MVMVVTRITVKCTLKCMVITTVKDMERIIVKGGVHYNEIYFRKVC